MTHTIGLMLIVAYVLFLLAGPQRAAAQTPEELNKIGSFVRGSQEILESYANTRLRGDILVALRDASADIPRGQEKQAWLLVDNVTMRVRSIEFTPSVVLYDRDIGNFPTWLRRGIPYVSIYPVTIKGSQMSRNAPPPKLVVPPVVGPSSPGGIYLDVKLKTRSGKEDAIEPHSRTFFLVGGAAIGVAIATGILLLVRRGKAI